MTGMPDRTVRHEIEELRNNGTFVINDEDGNGYYLSEDTSDVMRQYLRDKSRLCALSKRMKHERDFLKRRGVKV